MSFRKYVLLLICIFASVLYSKSQETTLVDSLKNELSNCESIFDSAKIYCQLCWFNYEGNAEERQMHGDLALKLARTTSDSLLISEAYDASALGYRAMGDQENAVLYYHQSLNIAIRHDFTERMAFAYYNLANIAFNANHNEQAKFFAEKARIQFKLIEYYDMMIECNNIKLKIDDISGYSETTIDTFIDDLKYSIINTTDSTYMLGAYFNQSYLYAMQENKRQSLFYIQIIMELAEKLNNSKYVFKTYYTIGNYFLDELKNYDLALVYFIRALRSINKDGNELSIADIYMQIGSVYRLMNDDSLAMDYYRKSLDIGTSHNHRHTRADSYRGIAEICYQNNQYDKALSNYLKSYEIGCDVCPSIKFHKVLIDAGNVYMHIKDYNNGYLYFQKSLDLADSSGSGVEKAISLQHLGKYQLQTGKGNIAIGNYEKALGLARSTNTLYLQRDISKELSLIFLETGNYKKAYELLNFSNTIGDSLEFISKTENLASLETKFEFQNLQLQKELELKENKIIADKEINKQSQLKFLFIIGLIVTAIIGGLIYAGYRRKRKDNKLLELKNKQIEKMSKEVHDADQAKLEFFTNVSHELKAPLTLILGITEKLKNILKDNDQLHIIRKNSLKLLQLVNHLLYLRKIDSAKMTLKVKEANLCEFLKGIVSSFENIALKKNIDIEFVCNESELIEYFDPDKVEKIITNLLSNAIKYNNENGSIKVNLAILSNGFAEIDVTDNGIGISQHDIKNIFKRFYRVADNNNQGSGIGLALVKELIDLHKGEIEVKCEKGKGSSFIVTLPVEKHFYADSEITLETNDYTDWNYVDFLDIDEENKDLERSEKSDINRKKVLIVEDNNDLRKFIADIFSNEYEIIEAKDGKEGCKKACENVPDIIISDIVMPKMSGIQLVEKIKNDIATSHIPVVLLTAKNDLNTQLNSFEKGADDYINKPFDSTILKSRVENLLRLRKQLVDKFSKQFQLQPMEITIEDADKKFLQKAIDIIENHMSNPNLDVDLLAMELSVSRTQLYRKLTALTDYPPKHFIRIIRLKRAAQILQQGQNNIAEVMDAIGFSNYSYFNNCFKEFYGKYPKDYAIVSVKGSLN